MSSTLFAPDLQSRMPCGHPCHQRTSMMMSTCTGGYLTLEQNRFNRQSRRSYVFLICFRFMEINELVVFRPEEQSQACRACHPRAEIQRKEMFPVATLTPCKMRTCKPMSASIHCHHVIFFSESDQHRKFPHETGR